MDNGQQVKGINYTKDGSVSLGEIRELSEDGEAELYEDIKKSQRKENENFIENMKNVLEIEKKNAVKKFAEILKAKVTSYLYRTNFDGHTDNVIDHFELCEIIDKSAKEYLK